MRNASFAKIMAHLLSRDDENAQVYIRSSIAYAIYFTLTHAYVHTHISINRDLPREAASSEAVLRRA